MSCLKGIGPLSIYSMRIRHSALFSALLATILASGSSAGAAAPNQLTDEEKAAGWKLLFDGTTTRGWHRFKKQTFPDHGWVVEDGWLHCQGKGGGDVISDEDFDQFELQWEWKLAPEGNSGLKYFVLETRPEALGHEYQLLDDQRHPDGKLGEGKRVTAAFYDVFKPQEPPPTRPLGEINQSRVVVKGGHVEHWLNGKKVLDYECGSAPTRAAVAQSKFKNVAGFGDCVKGHILLQDHHSEVWFRNLKIRPIK